MVNKLSKIFKKMGIKQTNTNRLTNKNRIKLFFTILSLEGMGGSEKVVFDMVQKLNKDCYYIGIISFKDGPIRSLYESLGIKVYIVQKRGKFDLSFILKLRRIIIREKIEIINAHHLPPLLYSAISTLGTKTKIVFTEHSKWQLEELHGIDKKLMPWLLRKSKSIVAISDQLEKFYMESYKLDKEKVKKIPNGIDLNKYKKKLIPLTKEDFGIKKNDRIIGTIAHIRPEKNHKLLISAFSKLLKEYNDIHLILVGLDLMNNEMFNYARHKMCSKKIHFLGVRKDVPDLLNLFDIFCLPSIHEGLPLSLLEAMSSEVPVLGANVIGINEVIHHGRNGILFESNSEDSLINSLRKMLHEDQLRKNISKAGREYVKLNFNLDHSIKKYDLLFRSLSSTKQH